LSSHLYVLSVTESKTKAGLVVDLNYNYLDVSKIHCPQQKCLHFANVICQFSMLLKSGLMFCRIAKRDGEGIYTMMNIGRLLCRPHISV